MVDQIIQFIASYIPLTDEEVEFIKELNVIESYEKNTILLSEGQVAKECYFVLKGCVRSYYLIDGDEKTTEFYTEQQAITPISYVTEQPSEYYLSCLEDCVVSLGRKNDLLIERIPRIKNLIIQFNSEQLVKNQISFDTFKNFSPEMRYLKLQETRPDLINRIPQYHLASYLGVTPESLSRIRKRLVSSKKSV
jgi:CRP-like cAMP-binding protein